MKTLSVVAEDLLLQTRHEIEHSRRDLMRFIHTEIELASLFIDVANMWKMRGRTERAEKSLERARKAYTNAAHFLGIASDRGLDTRDLRHEWEALSPSLTDGGV